jgi:hypothetical protein
MRVLRYWRLAGVGAAVAAVALCVGAALAADPVAISYPECTKKPTAADLDGAKGAHKAATQFYERGEYEKAIRYWNDALGFDCTANDLLLNIANAYEKKPDLPSTVATYEIYLKRTGPNPTLEEKLKNLRARLAPPDAGAAPTSTGPTPLPSTSTPTPVPTVTAPPVMLEGAHPYGNTPWFVVGGGGALALIGAILLPLGFSDISTANSACPSHSGCSSSVADQGNKGRTEAQAGGALFGIGVAAVAGGLVWQFGFNRVKGTAAPPAPAKAGLWVAPAGPGQVGVSAGGSF